LPNIGKVKAGKIVVGLSQTYLIRETGIEELYNSLPESYKKKFSLDQFAVFWAMKLFFNQPLELSTTIHVRESNLEILITPTLYVHGTGVVRRNFNNKYTKTIIVHPISITSRGL
jgi:hypothetical protein